MSDAVLYFLPTEPLYRPDPAAFKAAIDEARRLFLKEANVLFEVDGANQEAPEFICCAQLFESVHCPACQYDLSDWWQNEAMGEWFAGDRRNLRIVTPCCSMPTDLNALVYQPPQGFACCYIEIRWPGREETPDDYACLEAILGTPLKTIWAYI